MSEVLKGQKTEVFLTNNRQKIYLCEIFYDDDILFSGKSINLTGIDFKKIVQKKGNLYYNFKNKQFDCTFIQSFFSLVQTYDYLVITKNNYL